MSKFVALINGSTGVGKTTAAISIAKKYSKGVSIDVDTVKHFIKTGILGETIMYPEEIASMKKNSVHEGYYKMIAHTVCDIAERFLNNGYNVTISDMIWENWIIDIYKVRLQKHNFFHFMLSLPFEIQKERLVNRLKKDNVFNSFEEVTNRISAFSHALETVSKDSYILIDIGNMDMEQMSESINSCIIQKESSR